MGFQKFEFVVYPVLSVSEFLQGLAGIGLHQLSISNPLGLKPCLADLYRLDEAILLGFVFE